VSAVSLLLTRYAKYPFALYFSDRARYDLLSPGSSSKLKGSAIILSCVPFLDNPATASVSGGDPTTTPSHSAVMAHLPVTPSANVTTAEVGQDQVQLESFVHSAAEGSHLSTPPGIETAGTAMANISSVTTSDSFGTVMGFLEKLVKIGDAIAEVS